MRASLTASGESRCAGEGFFSVGGDQPLAFPEAERGGAHIERGGEFGNAHRVGRCGRRVVDSFLHDAARARIAAVVSSRSRASSTWSATLRAMASS